MSRELVKAIAENVEVMFFNCLVTLKTCDPDFVLCGAPLWKHCYHMLHSCDRWFINPLVFEEPPFHEQGLDSLDEKSSRVLTREELLSYRDAVREKVMDYLDSLEDGDLCKKPKGCAFSRLSLMIGQIRHFHAHLGNINAAAMVAENRWPRVVGMNGIGAALDENDLYET